MKSTSLESNREGRIVNVTSVGHKYVYREGIRFDKINDESSFKQFYAYGQCKLANILHANELSRRQKEEGVEITAKSIHPGYIYTNILQVGDGILGDLRDDKQFFIDHHGAVPITTAQGEELKKLIGAPVFIECSSKTQQNVKAVFDAAIKVVLQPPKQKKKKRKAQKACSIL